MFWVILDFQCVGMKICYIDYNIVHKAQVHLSWSKCKPVFPTNKIQLSVAGHGKVQVKLKKIPRWQKFSLEEDAWKNMTGFRSFCNIIMVVLFGSRWRQIVYLWLHTLLVDFTWYDDGDWLRLRRDSFTGRVDARRTHNHSITSATRARFRKYTLWAFKHIRHYSSIRRPMVIGRYMQNWKNVRLAVNERTLSEERSCLRHTIRWLGE